MYKLSLNFKLINKNLYFFNNIYGLKKKKIKLKIKHLFFLSNNFKFFKNKIKFYIWKC